MPLCSIHTKQRPKLNLYLESLSEKNADKNCCQGHPEDNLDVADVGKTKATVEKLRKCCRKVDCWEFFYRESIYFENCISKFGDF